MLDEHQLTLLGYDPTDHDSFDEQALRQRRGLVHASDTDVRADPIATALRAVSAIATDDASIVVHFDVDAVDSRDLALANFPHYGTGIPLHVARQVLGILLNTPGLTALVLTQVNPTHDPAGTQLDRYIDTIVAAIASFLSQ